MGGTDGCNNHTQFGMMVECNCTSEGATPGEWGGRVCCNICRPVECKKITVQHIRRAVAEADRAPRPPFRAELHPLCPAEPLVRVVVRVHKWPVRRACLDPPIGCCPTGHRMRNKGERPRMEFASRNKSRNRISSYFSCLHTWFLGVIKS